MVPQGKCQKPFMELNLEMTPEERAKKSALAMWQCDQASKWLGMEIVTVSEGHAELSMAIETHHANSHGTCHGGMIYTLADSTFAFACNSRNQNTVAQHCVMTYVNPAYVGDHLTAVASEISTSGRNGIYDVNISNSAGKRIAEFRGFSRTIKGQIFQEKD